MVDQAFLDKLRRVCDAIESSRGPINLFAIFKMDELTDKWTVAICAAWTSELSFEDIFTQVRALLIENLGDEMSTIARISVHSLNDHFAQLAMQNFSTGDTINTPQQLNGNLVHEGYILKVARPE